MVKIPDRDVIAQACMAMPLFPLPRVVLFPNTILRLHVFEPRYVQLLRDCMSGNQLMAIPMLKENQREVEPPSMHPISGFGMVVHCEALENNRYNIVLLGLGRIHIQEELESDTLYRIARCALLEENNEEQVDLSGVKRLLTQIVVQNPHLSGSLDVFLEKDIPSHKMLNIIGHLTFRNIEGRQQFIEKNSLQERVFLLEECLADLLMRGNTINE